MDAVPFDIANDWEAHPEFCIPVEWRAAAGDSIILEASVGGERWAVRINDFPDEPLFTLIIGDTVAMHFDDWPGFWVRPS